jgi:acetate kinase
MEKIIILSNLGSTSKKYSVYKNDEESSWFHIEKASDQFICSSKIATTFEKRFIQEEVYQNALSFVIEELIKEKIINSKNEVKVVAIRTVIPSSDFQVDMHCTDEILEKIKTISQTDPLHINPVLEEIQLVQTYFENKIDIQLISDSAFHISYKKPIPLPFENQKYTIGYHGLACQSVVSVLNQNLVSYSKLIIAHLGGGCSVTGVAYNKSVFNSMQFSPLGGMIMSSRSGSLDPLVLVEYIKQKNSSLDEVLSDLYQKSGLLALSGISSDLRVVREHALAGSKQAKDAIMFFVDSIVENILRASAYTQGIDTLVFSGTIGMRALYIRELVCEKLLWLGFEIDHMQNTEGGTECLRISSHDSSVSIYVVQIDEMKEMYKHAQLLFKKSKK